MQGRWKAAALASLGLLVAAPAFAGDYNRYGYDDRGCEQTRRNSSLTGALLGGAIGAALGHEVAARNSRDEGLLLGGALGAVVGANAGGNRVYCNDGPRETYYAPARPVYSYGPAYDDRYHDRGWGREHRRDRVVYRDRYDDDDQYEDRYRGPVCKMSVSRVRLPNGRTDEQAVKVCQGNDGQWRIAAGQ